MRSLAFPSPGHQATMLGGAETQACAPRLEADSDPINNRIIHQDNLLTMMFVSLTNGFGFAQGNAKYTPTQLFSVNHGILRANCEGYVIGLGRARSEISSSPCFAART